MTAKAGILAEESTVIREERTRTQAADGQLRDQAFTGGSDQLAMELN